MSIFPETTKKTHATSESRQICIGLAQFSVRTGDTSYNLAAAIQSMESLAQNGATLVLLPELWSCGFDNENMEAHAGRTPSILAEIQDICQRLDIIAGGSLPEKHAHGISNTFYLVDKNGNIAGKYRKIHLFSPMGEDRIFVPGNEAIVCDTSLARIGLAICFDLRFPELFRKLAIDGAEIIMVSAQWPAPRIRHWDILMAARAVENQVFVAGVNTCARTKAHIFPGHSRVISPEGHMAADAGTTPGTASAMIDLGAIKATRSLFDTLQMRAPEAYEIKNRF